MSEPPPAPEPRPATGQPPAERPAGEQPTAAQPTAAQPAPPPPPVAPQRRFGRVVRHRATQLVAVGLLGSVLGGGLVALLDRDRHRTDNADRPGASRFDDRGPGRGDFDRRERRDRQEPRERQDRGDR
ncbi:hypothetical protein [Saccharothrix xinjiangensis]|uniref:Uncharacterized protein n=1 Tax=Saccharothrix xinjiangensis TaxID=204798 RepID=A0ABV9XTM8_9PSEU